MIDDTPNDPSNLEYRLLVWKQLRWEFGSLISLPWKEDAEDEIETDPRYVKRRDVLIDAEIERRRIAMIHRENHGRMARGEPLIDPFAVEEG
jgi:hypothetical protein